jgi:hypothetical protein
MQSGLTMQCCWWLMAMSMHVGCCASAAYGQSVLRETIRGYSEVYSVSEQGPVYLYAWFQQFPTNPTGRRTLERVTFDFTGRPVHFDADGQRVEIITNNFVQHASFFPREDAQVFGFNARSFASRGTVICKLDLDRGPTLDENPFTKDYLGGTVSFRFSDGLEFSATFARQGSFGTRTAKAEFWWSNMKQSLCCEARCGCLPQRRCGER